MTIEVTQEDRDRVAEYVGANFGVKFVAQTKRGESWTGLSEAFARHRQAAYEQGFLDGGMHAVRGMKK